ncbi:hypothetical protein [Idiomarina xiamenensis]|uniref:Uncharacterized protein n=1 Tax=Idiomarina xiamenensis 10-D-4 TaxID=740709 RepID=K2K1S5_9GAMM|nr:hypothetical protein [Idiomarina xiamenensis]EKE80632.1 hypothetical protein A10D4_11756 [Idiomarina xiamenensis 10-D-4]
MTSNLMKAMGLTIALASAALTVAGTAYALNGLQHQQNSGTYVPGAAYDCSGISLDQQDPTSLTREEKIAQLEKTLQHSIDDYATCLQQVQADMASAEQQSGQAAAGQTGNGQSGAGQAQGQQQGEQGAQQSSSTQTTSEQQHQQQRSQQGESSTTEQEALPAAQPGSPPQGAGGPRQAVPPADNASVLCTLLWQQIEQASDAASKEKLTQQYLDYNCGKS